MTSSPNDQTGVEFKVPAIKTNVASGNAGTSQGGSSPAVPTLIKSDEDNDDDASVSTMFPAPNSVQRAGGSSLGVPSTFVNKRAPPPQMGGLKLPPSTLNPPRSLMQYSSNSSSTLSPSPAAKARRKVALQPGHSAMDWAALRNSGKNLRGIDYPGILNVTPSELVKHKSKDDCWTVLGGRVYNITPYLPFHPGGEKILMAVAGKDGTNLFMKTHSWVSFESMLDKCMVGIYCP